MADRDVPWTPDEVLDQLARAGTYAAEVGKSLLAWEKAQPKVEMTGGRGARVGTLRFAASTGDGAMLRLLLLYADPAGHPSLEIHVANLLSVPPYDRDEAAGRLLAELRGLGILRLLDDSVQEGIWPGIPLDQLTDGRIERLLAVIDHWIETAHA